MTMMSQPPSIQMTLSDSDSNQSSQSTSPLPMLSDQPMVISESGNIYEICGMVRETRLGGVYHARLLVLDPKTDTYVRHAQPLVLKTYDKLRVAKLQETVQQTPYKYQENPLNEMMIMTLLSQYNPHGNIMKTIEIFSDLQFFFMVMPYCHGGDVMDLLERHEMQGIAHCEARKVLRQVLMGLRHLHDKGIAHRDLSVENIVYNPLDDTYMIIDLGMSLHVPSHTHTHTPSPSHILNTAVCGKPNYIAPEVWAHTPYIDPYKGDVWALGVMVFMMVTGCAPMHTSKATDMHYQLICEQGRLMDVYVASCKRLVCNPSHAHSPTPEDVMVVDLMQRMLSADPIHRISIQDILAHPWMMGDGNAPVMEG
ncbi:serine/threonine-protein kinase [archaeon]|nr:MAG: serine/threonine-protein kinase [archaeon]